MARPVRIGCYSAFWGDTPSAARQLVEAEDARLDYLVADYLAEVTMGLLARSYRTAPRSKTAPKPVGYIKEFLTLVLAPLLPKILAKGIKVITNAGGLDPVGLAQLIEEYAAKAGLSDKIKVAAVYGDDLLDSKDHLLQTKAVQPFDPLNGQGKGEDLFSGDDKLLSLNAYIGAEAIARGLSKGANIIVTGRCVDSAAIVGPVAFEYDWDFAAINDQQTLDRLASVSLAGHVVECGAQATGGNFTDWKLSSGSGHGGWANMGYPIVTFQPDGTFVVTKPEKTGGLVTTHTVGEQILYEVLDPENYILPDVIIDLSQITLTQIAKDTVKVTGTKGKPPTPWLKCTAVKQTGYRIQCDLLVFGDEADAKGTALAQAIIQRANNLAVENGIVKKNEQKLNAKIIIVGAEHSISPSLNRRHGSREVIVRVAAKHARKEPLEILSRELASFATSSASGITLFSSGRPKVSPNFTASSILLRREAVIPKLAVAVDGSRQVIEVPLAVQGCKEVTPSRTAISLSASQAKSTPIKRDYNASYQVLLIDVAVGRSGDKGDTSNVAIIARDPLLYPYIREQVTPDVIYQALGQVLEDDSIITRYEAPGLNAVNFTLTKSLGGGGLDSLALDRQGKGYAQICLASIHIAVPLSVIAQAKL